MDHGPMIHYRDSHGAYGGGVSHQSDMVQSLFMQNHQLHQTLQHEKIHALQRQVETLARQHQEHQHMMMALASGQPMSPSMAMGNPAMMGQPPMLGPPQPMMGMSMDQSAMMGAAAMGHDPSVLGGSMMPPTAASFDLNQIYMDHEECKGHQKAYVEATSKEKAQHDKRKAVHDKFKKLRDDVRRMQGKPERKKAPCLGVIRLDYNYPPAEGDIDSPGSYGYDILYRVIPGLTFDMAQAGKFTPEVEKNFAEGIKWLESKKVSAMTGDCGFMMAFQVPARQIATVPVFMSSMTQCPVIATAFDPREKFLILTANDASLKPQKEILLTSCGFKVDDDRFKIIGCQSVEGFDAVARGEKVPLDVVQPGIVKLAKAEIKKNPSIVGILLECTELPPYADALRAHTGLPVWDAITGADFYISGYKDNPRFGVDDWMKDWEGVKDYTFGQNLIEADKRDLVNKAPNKQAAKAKAKQKALKIAKNAKKKAAPTLGVVRLDYNYPPAAGDIDQPGSFEYDVIYKTVTGLTFEMAQSGKMTHQVQCEFVKAIEWLENKGASGITGDCGFMMAFQPLAREVSTVPVFMSSMVQCPLVSVAFDKYDKILILTANGATLKPQKEALLNHCGFDVDEDRFVIAGCQDIPGFDAVAKGGKVDVEFVTPGMIKMVKKILQMQPSIRAIILECTELPPYSDALRRDIGLPVWDAITCCDFFISARRDNPRFGLNQWQCDWDHDQSGFEEGLNDAQRKLLRIGTKGP